MYPMNSKTLKQHFNKLNELYSTENWWPASSQFEVMVGAILTQNTSWSNVDKAINNLKNSIDLHPLNILRTSNEILETLIYPAGYYRVKTRRLKAFCEMLIAEFDGSEHKMQQLPWQETRSILLNVNGIGPETADDILLYALNKPVFIVDQYTMRIFSRLGYRSIYDSYEEWQTFFMQSLPNDADLFKKYHALIVSHAQLLCRKSPLCEACPLNKVCQFATTFRIESDINKP